MVCANLLEGTSPFSTGQKPKREQQHKGAEARHHKIDVAGT